MSVVSLRGRLDGRGPGRQAGRDGGGDRPGARRGRLALQGGLRARPRVAREHQLANADRVLGRGGAVDRLVELAGEAGAQRALRLQVGAAFHSELMKPVQDQMRERSRRSSGGTPRSRWR